MGSAAAPGRTRFGYEDGDVVVVVGSGAGGGTLADELCHAGLRTVVLEAGAHPGSGDAQEWPAFGPNAWLDARTSSGSWRLARDFPDRPAWALKAVGGTSTRWDSAAARLQGHELTPRRAYGEIDGANLLDWPLGPADLGPFYEQAERRLGRGRRRGRPLEATGSAWSALSAELPPAARTGRLDLRPGSHAVQVTHDARGRVDGVVYLDQRGALRRQRARVVCVAGNAIESARLLLLSSSPSHPDGLANSSGQVGRNHMRQLTGAVFAALPEPPRGGRPALPDLVVDEAHHDLGRGFAGGFRLEAMARPTPSLLAAYADPGGWGPGFAATIAACGRTAGLRIVGADLPRETNRVTLNAGVRDQHGLPAPNVHCDDHPNDIAMREHAWARARALLEAAGADGCTLAPPFPSLHNLGTCRMSERSQDGVVNGFGQSHDVPNLFVSDGSVFTAAGAGGPTLTIVALAIRQAEHIADEIRSARI